MATRTPIGGRGSNQYQTRGAPQQHGSRVALAAVTDAATSEDTQEQARVSAKAAFDHDALANARFWVAANRPYFSSALFRCPIIPSYGLPTMGIDKNWRIYINPDFADSLTVEEYGTVLIHEIGHRLRQHAERAEAQGWDLPAFHERWNIAADLEINDDLLEEGLPIDDATDGGGCWPSKFGLPDGETAEFYFENLPPPECPDCQRQMQKNQSGSPDGDSGSGGGDGEGDQDGAGQGGGAGDQGGDGGSGGGDGGGHQHGPGQRCPHHGGEMGQGGAAGSQEGSGVTGGHGRQPWEMPADDNREGQPVSDAEGDLMRRQTAKEIREFAKNQEKSRGTLASGWQRWAEEVLNPKVDWRKTLGAQVRNALANTRGMANHSYSRLSRRQSSVPDVVMPGWVRPVPRVKIVIDTSGSMGGDDLNRAVAEVGGILKTAGVADDEVEVISVDAAVNKKKKVRNAKQIELEGGGGTDMRVGIDAALTGPERPNVVVVMTDGYTPWPENPPPKGTKIIACIISPDGSAAADTDTVAGFGIPSFIKTVAVSH